MKIALPLTALALAALALTPQARAEDAATFEVAAQSRLSRTIAEANGRAVPQAAPIVVEILGWDDLPEGVSANRTAEQPAAAVAAPSRPAERR